ncbi:autotransporter assembly complex family protein [Magnetospirillum sp. UT-4]|uniref:autotransporter assembly complex protein TamA n=1 Tax=Magnetospirillum sp. UT-4 TaxID=2681467 RepID=UPI0013829E8B|nr:BamA/TamA family outer membrane protein [Magnetospirillum sp. UT-4]CAA7626167.1 putative Surface antigen [Magnetospirillum sp. UT-4]
MRLAVLILLATLAPLPAGAQDVPYRVALEGIDDSDLRRRIEEESRLVQGADRPPASVASLRARAEADIDAVQAVLRSEGYYGGTASVAVDAAAVPAVATLTVQPGPAYRLVAYRVHFVPQSATPEPETPDFDQLGLEIGQRARAEAVVAAQTALLGRLSEQGYPLAQVADRQVVVDHRDRSMQVTLQVAAGPLARFGEIRVEGLERLDPDWVRNRVPWAAGERFSLSRVEEMRKTLSDSRLFSTIKITTAERVVDGERLPVTVTLDEADRRSVGAAASWSSNEGFGGELFWEHRSLHGGAERLRTGFELSQIRTGLDFLYRNPDTGAVDQDLLLTATAEERRTDAFVTRTIGASGGLEWLLSRTWRASAATALERTAEDRDNAGAAGRARQFTLLSFPLEARHDSTDDLLDPTSGNRMRLQLRPFFDVRGDSFTRIDLYDAEMVKVLDDPRVVLAGWARIGAILGGGFDAVPADKRLYVGGGGSVRAFAYQEAGPLEADNTPAGGLSALAFGAEARINVTDAVAVVPFVEAGRAFRTRRPDFGEGLLWGAGLGLRYNTPFGPVRADVAVPVNPRPDIDDPFQVYLSLGQAF